MKAKFIGTAVVVLALAGCGGGSDYSNNAPPQQPPNQGPVATPFATFVKSQLAQTSDTTEPASVNDLQFDFGDIDDENAFSDVLF